MEIKIKVQIKIITKTKGKGKKIIIEIIYDNKFLKFTIL
jgi:hypothetical protein